MDYGQLIRDAWTTTWRYRFLWVIGIFAGGAASTWGGSSGGNGGTGVQWRADQDWNGAPPEMQAFASNAAEWAAANVGLIVSAVALLVLVGLVWAVVSLVAQGAMASATLHLAEGEGTTAGSAWRDGLHLFWRYLGLWAVLVVAAILVATTIGGLVALVVGGGALAGAPNVTTVVLAVLIGLPLAIATIAAAVVVSIVVAFAQRAIAADNVGPIDGLREGWQVLRAHPGTSLLVWVIQVGLSIVAGLVAAVVMLPLIAVLGGVGAVLWMALGFGTALITYGALGLLVLLAVGLLVAGIANTFFWSYWTLAYVRLTGGHHRAPVAV